MNNITLKNINDIPKDWNIVQAFKKSLVQIRDAMPNETFKVSWQDSLLIVNPEEDMVLIGADGAEYPCKKDIFHKTYFHQENGFYRKSAITELVEIPEGFNVYVHTLEGEVRNVQYPDYVVIGVKSELYPNKKEWVDENLEIVQICEQCSCDKHKCCE